MIIVAIGLDHLTIMNSISVRHVVDNKPSSLFKFYVSHLESANFQALVHGVWNLFPCPKGGKGYILWWKVSIHNTMNFIMGWGCMIS